MLEHLLPSFFEFPVEYQRENVVAEIAVAERLCCRCRPMKSHKIQKLIVRELTRICRSKIDWPSRHDPVCVRKQVAQRNLIL